MALCLPLAVLLGYMLAEPMDGGTFAVITLVLVVLSVPLIMKWNHPMLVLAWNCFVAPAFLPGQPQAWMIMAPVALLFAMLNRAVNPDQRFISVPSVTRPLLFLLAVILLTAWMTGGIGFRSLGGSTYGSRAYFYMTMAIAGYFAFASQRIAPERGTLYVGAFFLIGLTSLIPHIIYLIGPSAFFLYEIFPFGGVLDQAKADAAMGIGIFRINGLAPTCVAIYSFLLARYGIRAVLDLRKIWRLILLLLAVAGCVQSGFRSAVLMFVLVFAALFIFEGLHRTRILPTVFAVGLTVSVIVLPFADRLPLVAQRSLSFLPIKLDPAASESALASSRWRLDMWRAAVPDIPKYFWKGKGYAIDPNELFLANIAEHVHGDDSAVGTRMVGDYHNGPLSVMIPLGIWGVIGFAWFLTAGCRLLYRNARYGDPRLKRANMFLLASFVAKIVFFVVVFGSLYTELYTFTGLIGLSVSLNGSPQDQVEEEEAEPEEAVEAFG